jgi:[acyl-carrier-protein] S-malonyltransferase
MSIAFVFPGQGSQQVGMGRALAEASTAAREVFDEVDEALGQKLSTLMWEGPEDELTLTENAQPALMAVSLAVVRVLMAEHGIAITTPAYVAGHSLGEYSALAAAGTFGLADTARLLKLARPGDAARHPGGHRRHGGPDRARLRAAAMVARDAALGEICQPANDNAPGQVVVSGHRSAVERAVELAKARGARRALMLTVSAPFHCTLMQPAAEVMAEALERSR